MSGEWRERERERERGDSVGILFFCGKKNDRNAIYCIIFVLIYHMLSFE